MNHSLHRALDGELHPDELLPQERLELQRYRATIGTALAPMRQLGGIDIAARVMERLSPGPVSRALRSLVAALWAPRTLTVRPALALTGVVAASALWLSASNVARTASPSPPPGRVVVQFRLGQPGAHDVALVGDFNGWQPAHRLHQVADGVWAVDVALEPGVYNYMFVVDGTTLRLDPLAPRVTDGFGGASSRLAVLAPEPRS